MAIIIPKLAHWIWIGNKPLPDRYDRFIKSFRKMNPAWRVCFWDNAACRKLMDYHTLPDIATQSNILRIKIVREFGGIYMDVDVEPIKPIDSILDGVEAFCGIEDASNNSICNGIFGATSNHPWCSRLIRTSVVWMNRKPPWGPAHMTAITRTVKGVTVFDQNVFSPVIPWKERSEVLAKPETVLLHHYDGSWWGHEPGTPRPIEVASVS